MIHILKHKFLVTCIALMSFTTSMSCHANQTQIDDTSINTGGAVIDDYVFYNIGGGRAVSMSKHNNMQSIKIGAGWNSDMNLKTTIQNQLNGVTNGFQQIMGSVINNATSAVASLPVMILQRADPALYNLLTNGILQARLDYDRSKLTCLAMTEKWPTWLVEVMVGGNWYKGLRCLIRSARTKMQSKRLIKLRLTKAIAECLGWGEVMPGVKAKPN